MTESDPTSAGVPRGEKFKHFDVKPDFSFIIEKPNSRIMIVGGDGSGKTVTAHYLLEQYHLAGVKVAYLAPMKIIDAKTTPPWLKLHHWKYPRLEPHTVTLIDDAQLQMHSREHYMRRNITYDKIFTLARHEGRGVIITTQETFRIDKNLMSRLHFLLIKKPSMFAAKTERPWLRSIMETVDSEYEHAGFDDPRQYTVVISDRYTGFVGPTGLPSYWKTELGDW